MDVRPATRADLAESARVLARAFHRDPNFVVLLPDAARRPRALERLFGAELKESLPLGAVELAVDGSRISGAAVWYPPGTFPLPLRARLRSIPAGLALMASYPSAARRMLAMVGGLEENRPREDHWYLGTVGVDTDAHGQGAGAALLAHGLARADGDRMPSYLETATQRNADWYARLGFETTGRTHLVEGGPECWLMWRAGGPL